MVRALWEWGLAPSLHTHLVDVDGFQGQLAQAFSPVPVAL